MKISDLIKEDKDSIRTYWQLRNSIDIESYNNIYQKIINDTNDFRARQDMLMLSSHVVAILSNPDWQYLENDPDFDVVYDSLLDLHDKIDEYFAG